MLDNASYHSSQMVYEYFALRRVPVIYSEPYSLDSAPIEKLFAFLKKGCLQDEFENQGTK